MTTAGCRPRLAPSSPAQINAVVDFKRDELLGHVGLPLREPGPCLHRRRDLRSAPPVRRVSRLSLKSPGGWSARVAPYPSDRRCTERGFPVGLWASVLRRAIPTELSGSGGVVPGLNPSEEVRAGHSEGWPQSRPGLVRWRTPYQATLLSVLRSSLSHPSANVSGRLRRAANDGHGSRTWSTSHRRWTRHRSGRFLSCRPTPGTKSEGPISDNDMVEFCAPIDDHGAPVAHPLMMTRITATAPSVLAHLLRRGGSGRGRGKRPTFLTICNAIREPLLDIGRT
jgi:hypothetical protein